MCSPWMHDLLSNVLAKRERGRALPDRLGGVIKRADFLLGIILGKRKRGLATVDRNSAKR